MTQRTSRDPLRTVRRTGVIAAVASAVLFGSTATSAAAQEASTNGSATSSNSSARSGYASRFFKIENRMHGPYTLRLTNVSNPAALTHPTAIGTAAPYSGSIDFELTYWFLSDNRTTAYFEVLDVWSDVVGRLAVDLSVSVLPTPCIDVISQEGGYTIKRVRHDDFDTAFGRVLAEIELHL